MVFKVTSAIITSDCCTCDLKLLVDFLDCLTCIKVVVCSLFVLLPLERFG